MVYSERPIYKHTTRDMDNPTVFELEKLSGSSQADPIRLGRVRSLDNCAMSFSSPSLAAHFSSLITNMAPKETDAAETSTVQTEPIAAQGETCCIHRHGIFEPCPDLAALPVEIIRQIAIHAGCESVLQLMQASQRLREACNDWTVFKSLGKCAPTVGNATSKCTCGPDSGRSSMLYLRHFDIGTCFSFLDHMNACKLPCSGIVQWLPSFIASHHPLLLATDIRSLLQHLDRDDPQLQQLRAFCIVAHVLSDVAPRCGNVQDVYSNLSLQYDSSLSKGPLGFLGHPIAPPTALVHEQTTNYTIGWPNVKLSGNELADLYSSVYMGLVSFSVELRVAIAKEHIVLEMDRGWPQLEGQSKRCKHRNIWPLPPKAFDIPFRALMRTLPLGSPASTFANYFNTSHLLPMTSPESIEDGTWDGHICTDPMFWSLLYAHDRYEGIKDPKRASFSQPIRGMRITVREDHEAVRPGVIVLRTSGHYDFMHESYHFDATLRQSNGVLVLTQNRGYTVQWQGLMTPFGIVAAMGDRRYTPARQRRQVTSWMWLWKSAWTPGYHDAGKDGHEDT